MNIFRFRIPLRKELKLQRGILTERCGFIVGFNGNFAEISPLPEFSDETADEAFAEIIAVKELLDGNEASGISPADILTCVTSNIRIKSPSVQFALWMLSHPLNNVEPKSSYRFILGTPAESFRLCTEHFESVRARDSGTAETVIKLKIGIYSRNEELGMISRITDLAADAELNVKLILDANLSQDADSVTDYYLAAGRHLKYIEDPCNDVESLRQKHPDFPIAHDELLRNKIKGIMRSDKEFGLSVFDSFGRNDTLIIKPGLTGNIHKILDAFFSAGASQRNGLPSLTLSSAFESPVGISYIEKLSALMNFNAPGTDTLKFFPEDAGTVDSFLGKYCTKVS